MDISRDWITLTNEERRSLAALEDRIARHDGALQRWPTGGSRSVRLQSRRVRDAAAVALLLAGAALMTATFATRPVVSLVGVAFQAIALWAVVTRSGPFLERRLRRWIRHRRQHPGSAAHPAHRRG